MNLKKRLLSALVFGCMILALLPNSAMGTDFADVGALEETGTPTQPGNTAQPQVSTEYKQLEHYDPSGQRAYFRDGTSYYVEDTGGLDLNAYEGHWFTCIIVAYEHEDPYIAKLTPEETHDQETGQEKAATALDISVGDVERAGETYRAAGTDGAFEDAASFQLPITVTVTNTAPHQNKGDHRGAVLEIHSVELYIPPRFVFDASEHERKYWSEEVSLSPGEKMEYNGYLMVDDSTKLIQSKALEYTVLAAVKTSLGTLEGKAAFYVTPVEEAAPPKEEAAPSGEYAWLPTERLDSVKDPESAAEAVREMTGRMSAEQKEDPDCVSLAMLFAETAAAKAAVKEVEGGDIALSLGSVGDLSVLGAQASRAVESALSSGGVAVSRELSTTVTLKTKKTDKIDVRAEPSVLSAGADKIRVETPSYALTLKTSDLEADLKSAATISAQRTGSSGAAALKLSLPNGQMANPVTVSLPQGAGDTAYKAIVRSDGSAFASKYNPVTRTMDGKVNASGTYSVKSNEKSFSDISGKSAEMQKAILYLTSKGIINGTSATEFSPDKSISRQQIAALLMRALGKVDNTAEASFTDVSKTSSLYRAIASSQRHKIINGYSDNTFRGTNVISKVQIVTVSGRVLTSEMRYKVPSNTAAYLGKYSDAVPAYAQDMTALATREGLVVYRTDGTFSGDKNMTRGDAAVILYRLFQRIW